MNKSIIAFIALAASSFAFAQTDAAEQSNSGKAYNLTLSSTVISEYLFRGYELADATFVPSLQVDYKGAYVRLWALLPEDVAWDQINLTLGYKHALNDNVSLDAGIHYYYFSNAKAYPFDPGSDASRLEPYIGVSTELYGVSANLYALYDTNFDDLTLQAQLGYSLPIEAINTSLDFSATLGFVNGDLAENVRLFSNYWYYGVGVSVPYALSDNASVRVGLDWTDVSRNAVNNNSELTFSAGITFKF